MSLNTTYLNPSFKNKLKLHNQLWNTVRSQHSFGKIKTWLDYLLAIGHDRGTIEYAFPPEQLSKVITFKEVKAAFESLELQLTNSFLLEEDKALVNSIIQRPIKHEYEGILYDPDDKVANKEGSGTSHYTDEQLAAHNKHLATLQETLEEEIQLPHSPKQNATLFQFQVRAARDLLHGVMVEGKRAQLLIAGAGLGKTYIIGAFIRRILDNNFLENKTMSPWPIILVTRAPIVIQTIRVLESAFGINCSEEVTVINIEQLRSKFGEMFVNEKTSIVNGEEQIDFVWRKTIYPAMILLDECQSVMRDESIQSRIMQAYNNIDSPHTYQVYFSATPFAKVAHAKCFCVATHLKSVYVGNAYGGQGILTNETWDRFASNVSAPSDPEEYNEAAVERLMSVIMPYVVDVKGVRPQFKPINHIEIIQFETPEDKKFYTEAWERWQRDKARIEGEVAVTGGSGQMAILAAFTKFRQAAELCRANILARRFAHRIKEGFAPVIACVFKTTIVRVVSLLVTKYKIPRNKISLIWGGKNEAKSKALKKKELREKMAKHKDFLDELLKMGSTMSELGLSTSDVAELMDEEAEKLNRETASLDLRLGIQSKIERQSEIDKFQSGITDGCIFTTKAGGVGLSLHHCDDYSPIKVRRNKKSNWALVEDIDKVPINKRILDATPVYSAIEMVQVLGRTGRLTSLSNTDQYLLFFADTIEVDVAASVSQKLKCVKKVVRSREAWESIILSAETNRPHHNIDLDYEDIKSDDNTFMGDSYPNDDDNDED